MLSVRIPSVRDYFPYEPTQDQALLFQKLDVFLKDELPGRKAFVLRGYAGTGKTTVVSALVQWLQQRGRKYTLMAPTGRAAKVMSVYSGVAASTIHKKIYRQTGGAASDRLNFQRQPNRTADMLYIVDEASMISDEKAFGENGLLDDLLGYVFEKPTNRLLLIGDTAQLPPVGQLLSPALDPELLRHRFRAAVDSVELRQVMRQAEESGILVNATILREELREEAPHIQFFTSGYRDIFKMGGDKLEDGLRWAYKNFGHENTTIICRSNKNANQYNQYIRRILFEAEDEIESGDYLMVVRNNYFWLPNDSEMGFLANGDFVQVTKIVRRTEEFGFHFADARVRFVDYPDEPEQEVKLLLDTLHTESPALPADRNKALYDAVGLDYAHLTTKRDKSAALRKDPFLNALQVKFAYALTCHKAQGGQWQAVFVDHGFLKEDMVNSEFARWLYTAITRASERLFLLNFNQKLIADAKSEE
ncbi:ATP-dependent DNA helicase [Hymenobacter defluvii]|uniref:AAA family ATPase n=1 Tax=Hymenobacter defluvii TaxID=2054411 RepID=A0ABS3T5V7_9BACT|nr:AAA family ATPase [Hymenobacter defluvii]MBO3269042.1 AAA family ATPase [Hymenobacter defluvii]